MDWTEEAISRLQDLWREGLSTAEIGRRLGVTKNAVVGKAHRLSLSPRPSPIRKHQVPRPAPETAAEPMLAATTPDHVAPDVSPATVVATPPAAVDAMVEHSVPPTDRTAPAAETAPEAVASPTVSSEAVEPPAISAPVAPSPAALRPAAPPPPVVTPIEASRDKAAAPAPVASSDKPATTFGGDDRVVSLAARREPVDRSAEVAAETPAKPKAARPALRSIPPEARRRGPSCCWPLGDPGTPGFHFCGAQPLSGKPYCAEHAAVAYVKLRDRRDSVA